MAEITLKITADDSELMSQMDQISTSIEDIDESAASLGDSLDDSFSEGANASRKLNKQLDKTEKTFKKTTKSIDKTGKQMDKTGKKTKSLTAKLRGAQKSIGLMKFAAGGMFLGALSQMGAFSDAIDSVNNSLFPAIGLQNKVAAATKEVAFEYVQEKASLDNLFEASRNDNLSKEEKRGAIDKINEKYGEYLPKLLTENTSLIENEKAQGRATAAVLKRAAAQIKVSIAQALIQEAIDGQIDATTKQAQKGEGITDKIATGLTKVTNLLPAMFIGRKLGLVPTLNDVADKVTDVGTELDNIKTKSAMEQLMLLGKTGEGTFEGFLKQFDGISKMFGDIDKDAGKTGDDLKNSFNNAAKGPSFLEGSLADLLKKLADVNREIKEGVKAGDKEGLGPLISQSKTLEKQVELAKLAIKELRGEADETAEQRAARLKRQAELIIELTSDLEKKTVDQLRAAAKVQADDIKATVKDAKLRNELLIINNNQLQTDILASIDKFEKEKTDKKQAAAQERLEQELTLSEAELRAMQTAQTDELLTRGATEEEATKIQKEQEEQRQRLTLENEKKRLQLILQFSKGRTAIEIDETKATIAAINSELSSLGKEFAQEGEKKGLLEFLGIDISPEQLDAIKTVGAEVLGIIESNTQAQIDAANKSIDARDKEIDNLSAQLDRELEFRKAGLASNVEGIRENLNKEEALRKQALQERAAAQKTQFAIETATQGVNLITSATEIIKAFSTIPFVGVALGIAAVGAMFAGFVAARAKAFQSTKLAKGGMLEGKSHADGGVPMSVDGQYTYEGERGEWVTNSRDSAEHNKVLELINNGRFRGVDLMGIIKNGLYGGISKNTFDLRSSQRTQSENVQRGAVSSAIEKQTDILIQRMDRMYSRPQIRATDTGYLKASIGSNGNISITKFNKK